MEAAEFNELAALEPTGTGPAVPGVPYPRRRGRLGGLIAGVLSVPCELCGAPPGCGCDPVFAEMVRLAKSPPLVVHTGRMAGAIDGGRGAGEAVVAQFQGNPLPAAVAAVVAAARPSPASVRRADYADSCSAAPCRPLFHRYSVPQTSVLRLKF